MGLLPILKGGSAMDIVAELQSCGFDRVMVLDGTQCGYPEIGVIVLAFWPYEAERDPAEGGAWIHPYYFASQRAYEAAAAFAKQHADEGVVLRDDIRVKPIFARLPGFTQGRNTLSYTEEYGSRFHVQILAAPAGIPVTHQLSSEKHDLHCGGCQRCVDACPTNALEGGIFHRERCLRNWQMSGQPVPDEIRAQMGNRLIGCDVCQRVCPHNPQPTGEMLPSVPLASLLCAPKETAAVLRSQIGVNLSIPNRVLAQACLLAGCSGDVKLLTVLEPLSDHPSPAVSEHAKWAMEQLKMKHL